MECRGCGVEHDGVELLAAGRAGGGEVEFFDELALALLVGGCALRGVELVGEDLAVVLQGVFCGWGLVFDLFHAGGRGDGFGAVCVTVSFVGGIILVICPRVAGVRWVGVEEWRRVRFHLHLSACTTEG